MQTWVNPDLDRSTWGNGPWDGEPDKMYWVDEETQLPCLMVRANPETGNWCGYVAVEPDHPCTARATTTLMLKSMAG